MSGKGWRRQAWGGDTLSDNKHLTVLCRSLLPGRERNKEHAKRSRLRRKFLLESLRDRLLGEWGAVK